MSFGNTATALTAAQVDATTLVPLSKAGARNEIECDKFFQALLTVATSASPISLNSGAIVIVPKTNAKDVTITASTGAMAAAGGEVTITGGSSISDGGGDVNVTGGNGNATGGSIVLEPGTAAAGTNGTVVVRQPGGTPGTDELQLYHDGTDGYCVSKSGKLMLAPNPIFPAWVSDVGVFCTGLGFTLDSDLQIVSPGNGGFALRSNYNINWTSGSNYGFAKDLSIARGAPSVLAVTNGQGNGGGGTLSSVMLSPAQITGNVNNYAPGTARYIRLTSDGAYTITGLVAGVDGQEVRFFNVGANTLSIVHESASSTAANRFACTNGIGFDIEAGFGASAVYDATSARWRIWLI